MAIRTAYAFASLVILSLAGQLSAAEYKAGDLTVIHPWSRATPGAMRIGAGYMKITNAGEAADHLLQASSDIAERVELHRSTLEDGIAKMRPLDRIEIPARGTAELMPGGVHMMLVNLSKPLKAGDRFGATLTFERAGPVSVEFIVQGLGASTPPREHHQH